MDPSRKQVGWDRDMAISNSSDDMRSELNCERTSQDRGAFARVPCDKGSLKLVSTSDTLRKHFPTMNHVHCVGTAMFQLNQPSLESMTRRVSASTSVASASEDPPVRGVL